MIKITIFLFLFCLTVSAKTERVLRAIFIDATRSAPKSVTLYIAKESTVEKSRSILPRGEVVEIDLRRKSFSRNTEIPSGALVAWVLSKAPDPAEGIPLGAQKIRLPSDWKRTGLLFTSDIENKIFPAKVIPVNLSAADFGPGKIMFYNLSKNKIVGQFGSTNLNMVPESSKIIPTPQTENKSYPVKIDCILPDENERHPVVRSTWVSYNDSGVIKFILDSPNKKRPRVLGVKDKP